MAGPFYVDDGGDGDGGLSWAKAETSINDLDAAITFASGEIVYFGHNSQCQATNSANLVITGPTAGPPVVFISATQGSDPVTYAVSTTKQIDTTEGVYSLTFDGSFALYGISIASGSSIRFGPDGNEPCYAEECRFAPAASSSISNSTNSAYLTLRNCIIDLTADGTTNRDGGVIGCGGTGIITIQGLTLVNPGYRTGTFCEPGGTGALINISGADLSGLQSSCELIKVQYATVINITNCITGSTWTPTSGTIGAGGQVMITNTGPADAPTYIYFMDCLGVVASTNSIYRTGGQQVESEAIAYLITTTALCGEAAPFYTPWIYGTVDSTGSKTFDLYITNDTGDFNNSEVWLEVEYLSTADEALWAVETNQRTTITTTAAAQTDDTTSTWNGTGPSFTYKQKLSVTATVNETGQYRARVAVGVASIASSRYFYVDPKVTVT